ncbi:MAG: glycosyltransferase [Candidatus Helarchaeota archaeon]
MKISKVLIYGTIIGIYFVLYHLFFPSWVYSPIKQGINGLFTDFTNNWPLLFPFIGFVALAGLISYFGIHFLASFGNLNEYKTSFTPNISILIPSKNEKPLLERTLNSIIVSNYPKDKIQLILIISGSEDGSKEFCKEFADKNSNINIAILSDPIKKKGKPAALNYGLKFVKHEICIFYDAGVRIEKDTLQRLVNPLSDPKNIVTIGPIIPENYKINKWTRALHLSYAITDGGSIFFHVKNKLGSSAYLFGKNFCIRTKNLLNFNGFNEDALTEDLYLTVLLNIDGVKIKFISKAKVYELVPSKWHIIKKQRQRWIGGYVGDVDPLMKMKKGNKNGASIIISRNLTMLFLGHIDAFFFFAVPFAILYWVLGFYYIFGWTITFMAFIFGYIINAVRKYGDNHYINLLWMPLSAYFHLWEFSLQFSLPSEISWERTPILLEKDQEEIKNLLEYKKDQNQGDIYENF